MDLKYIILHLFSGICLLLKQLLVDEHWSLIFSDINKASKEKLQHGDFISVNFESTCTRLREIREFNIKESDLKYLHELRKCRNKIEHYSVIISKEQVVPLIFECCNFALEVIRKYGFHQRDEIQEFYFKFESNLSTLHEFVESRKNRIKKEIESLEKKGIVILPCPVCLQIALPLTGDSTACVFCHEKYYPGQLLEDWVPVHSPADDRDVRSISSLYLCESCGDKTVISLGPEFDWVCLLCAKKYKDYQIVDCEKCGQEYLVHIEETTPCPHCIDAYEQLQYSRYKEEKLAE